MWPFRQTNYFEGAHFQPHDWIVDTLLRFADLEGPFTKQQVKALLPDASYLIPKVGLGELFVSDAERGVKALRRSGYRANANDCDNFIRAALGDAAVLGARLQATHYEIAFFALSYQPKGSQSLHKDGVLIVHCDDDGKGLPIIYHAQTGRFVPFSAEVANWRYLHG